MLNSISLIFVITGQDYYCDLSPIQEQLYEDFARTRAHQSLRDNFGSAADDSTKHSHIFQVSSDYSSFFLISINTQVDL